MLRERLREGAVDEAPGDGAAVEIGLDGFAELTGPSCTEPSGNRSESDVAVAVGGRGDLHERARELPVDQPAVVVDQVEAAILANAGRLQLDLVDVHEAEALDRRVGDRASRSPRRRPDVSYGQRPCDVPYPPGSSS